MDKILQISQTFIDLLTDEISKYKDEAQIGLCFLKCANDMQHYYAIFCRDFDSINELIKKVIKSIYLIFYKLKKNRFKVRK